MHIVVCLKPVPDVGLTLELDPLLPRLDPYSLAWQMSPAERLALAEALRWRDLAGGQVTLISCGQGELVRDVLRQGLLAGADYALLGGAQGGLEQAPQVVPWLVARLKELAPDLVLCGHESGDRQRGEVGPGLARALGWPLATEVRRLEALMPGPGRLQAWHWLGGNEEQLSELPLPAVLTFQALWPDGQEGPERSARPVEGLLAALQVQPRELPTPCQVEPFQPESRYRLALARRPRRRTPCPDSSAPPAERMAALYQEGLASREGITLPDDPEEAAAVLLDALQEQGLGPKA